MGGEKTAENETEVDELSIIRQVKSRLDKLPDQRARMRVLEYVRELLVKDAQAEAMRFDAARVAEQLRTSSGHYV